MPPESCSKDEALTLAAHLVAKSNAALHEKGLPISTPRQLFDAIERRMKSPAQSIRIGPDGRVTFARPISFLSAVEALDVAASLVVVADPECNMLERVGAVIDAARGGKELEAALKDPRTAAINLTSPRRAARISDDAAAETIEAPPLTESDIKEACEDFIENSPHAEELRRMRKGGM
jgi:hypothetical protein